MPATAARGLYFGSIIKQGSLPSCAETVKAEHDGVTTRSLVSCPSPVAGRSVGLIDALEGFDKYGGWAIPFRDETGEELVLKRPVVVERLKWRRSMCSEEWVYLRSRKARAGKVTMISAQQAAAYYDPEKSKGAYPSRDAYLADIVDFSRREVDELVRLGCTYIQIDAPQYAALLDPEMREGYRKRGSDPDKLIDLSIGEGALPRHFLKVANPFEGSPRGRVASRPQQYDESNRCGQSSRGGRQMMLHVCSLLS